MPSFKNLSFAAATTSRLVTRARTQCHVCFDHGTDCSSIFSNKEAKVTFWDFTALRRTPKERWPRPTDEDTRRKTITFVTLTLMVNGAESVYSDFDRNPHSAYTEIGRARPAPTFFRGPHADKGRARPAPTFFRGPHADKGRRKGPRKARSGSGGCTRGKILTLTVVGNDFGKFLADANWAET